MTNKNILTNGSKVSQIELMYYGPVAVVPPYLTEPINVFYCFLAKPLPWDDEVNPPVPATDLKSLKQVYRNMFIVKKIKTNDISPVIQRVDWTSGVMYNYFQDDGDMFAKDQNGYITQIFYVKNKYDQILTAVGSYSLRLAPPRLKALQQATFELNIQLSIESGDYSLCASLVKALENGTSGVVIDETPWMGPFSIHWDYAQEVPPFYGLAGMNSSGVFLV